MVQQAQAPVKGAVHPRPYATHYYAAAGDNVKDWSRIGRASSPLGACRAAVTHLLRGRYEAAVVHGPGGEIMFRLRREKNSIQIFGLFRAHTFDVE